jgi:hypothetical protein
MASSKKLLIAVSTIIISSSIATVMAQFALNIPEPFSIMSICTMRALYCSRINATALASGAFLRETIF